MGERLPEVVLRWLDRPGLVRSRCKRFYLARAYRVRLRDLPPQADLIMLQRPPESVFRAFRRLYGLDPDTGEPIENEAKEVERDG